MKSQQGFTLVELMIVVVIVGILTTIAVPSYSSYLVRSARAAAQTELLQLASVQEKIYLNSSAYTANMTTAYDGQATGGLGKSPAETADGRYELSFNGTPSQSFEIQAKPKAGTAQVGDGCLTLNEKGQRQWYQSADNCTGSAIAWR